MDLLLEPMVGEPTQIVELKRGLHLLVARAGEPSQRISQQLAKAIAQITHYGETVRSDKDEAARIEERLGMCLRETELRLVAGRRFGSAQAYSLLSVVEADAQALGLELQIYTWDGLLAELERTLD